MFSPRVSRTLRECLESAEFDESHRIASADTSPKVAFSEHGAAKEFVDPTARRDLRNGCREKCFSDSPIEKFAHDLGRRELKLLRAPN